MQPFLTLDETVIDPHQPITSREGYYMREAARAVVLDKDKKVALLHVRRDRYYKLPGGGIDAGEDALQALRRELIEEIGCKVKDICPLGILLEQRYHQKMTQTSHCYVAWQTGKKSQPAFTEKEIQGGFKVVWAENIDEAIRLLESSQETADPTQLEVTFIRTRDVAIAKRAKTIEEISVS